MAQTKRELVKAALDCRPVDRVPVGFWHHFLADQRHADALADHSAWVDNLAGHDRFYHSWHPDFVKIMTDGFFLYPHEQLHDLKSIRDAENIKPLGRDSEWVQKQVELCGILTERYGKEVMVFYNLFAPHSVHRIPADRQQCKDGHHRFHERGSGGPEGSDGGADGGYRHPGEGGHHRWPR